MVVNSNENNPILNMKVKCILALCALLLFASFRSESQDAITIFMIGDSTMANKTLRGNNRERGWGQMLSGYFSEEIKVENYALNGRSSKSFMDEGVWDKVKSKIRKGDYVFIQFGHNDEKPDSARHTDPGTTFDANLRRYVNETRAKGGIPVLFNSIVRRNFFNNKNAVTDDDVRREKVEGTALEGDSLIDTHGAYLDSPRRVAAEMKVAFIDLNKLTHDLVQGLGVEGSKQLYMWIPEGVSPACPKGRQDNTHLNVYGARRVAGLAAKAVEQTIPELGKYVHYYDFVVAKDGSGDYFTIQDAINAVPDFRKGKRTTISVRSGEYKERVIVPECKINIALIGQTGAILTNDGYASKKNSLGDEMSTSGSATCYIYAPDFYAENMTFANTAGRVGQAVACFVSADRAYFKQCRFLGNQDTLYTYGRGCRQYYEDCYVEGTVDFIFGWSQAVFNRCTIHSLGKGYLTAPSTDKDQKYGYVFYDCRMTADEGVSGVFLSRPWRPYAKAVFIRCNLGKHIAPEGWNNWGRKSNEKTVFYAEYQSYGEGASPKTRVPYSTQLKNLKDYQIEDVLAGSDGWNPIKNGNALVSIKR